eukprot:gnl/MRDRNA2_/MRDRNA2_31706_c0_seq1.p1 gnl/MRDRNA2_/MRDRNA2_31706_c0~~gnl/MRDRNA2_/MRDRNA2_31706_c0_seq1.p1  ORF type:complete len:178 (-),score=11.29 gnl/MRDRNA2_/MRDRNA2_31706_c0_seq1:61-594(-)
MIMIHTYSVLVFLGGAAASSIKFESCDGHGNATWRVSTARPRRGERFAVTTEASLSPRDGTVYRVVVRYDDSGDFFDTEFNSLCKASVDNSTWTIGALDGVSYLGTIKTEGIVCPPNDAKAAPIHLAFYPSLTPPRFGSHNITIKYDVISVDKILLCVNVQVKFGWLMSENHSVVLI